MKITVLGAGKMGVSFSKSFLKYELLKPENLHLICKSDNTKNELQQKFPNTKVSVFGEIQTIDDDLIILSIKPQDFTTLANQLPFSIPKNAIVLSIMAGISIEKIQVALQHKLVIRAMPNSPTLLGMGITGYTAAADITMHQIHQVDRLMTTTGRAVYLEEEHLLDSVTALSGSGPAYFYYIVDAMIKAGIEMGIDENLSKLFVKQTMLGAYHLINNSDKSLDELISDVASKGGTTEAAIRSFSENNLKETLKAGIFAAEQRAQELNQ